MTNRLIDLMARKQVIESELKKEHKFLNELYIKHNKKKMWFLDGIVILAIVMNLFAVGFTYESTVLSAYQQEIQKGNIPVIKVVEANPIAGEIHDLPTVPTGKWQFYLEMAKKVLVQGLLLSLIIIGYILARTGIISDFHYHWVMSIYIILALMFAVDMFHDLGLVVAMKNLIMIG